jgi:hypothetical protein
MNTGSFRLRWNANTESDLAGYKLYVGQATGVYDAFGSPIDVGLVTSHVMTITIEGDWFFALTAYDTEDLESDFSSELQVDFQVPRFTHTAQRGIFRMNLR